MVAQPALDIVPIGLLLALGASVTYTAYILVSTHVLRGLRGEVASFYVMGGASLSFGLVGSLTGNWLGPGGLDLGVVDRPGGDGRSRHGLPPGAEARGSLPRFHPQPGGAPDIVFGERLAAHSYSWVPRWRPYP